MAETKPTKVGRWATDANRTKEPASGEKDVGWEKVKKGPARFFNWLHNVAYQWHNWLDERMFDGGVSGDLEVTGVDKTSGTDQDGGDLEMSGGDSTGDGGSELNFKVAKAGQGAGAAVRSAEQVGKFTKDMAFELKPQAAAPAGAAGQLYADSTHNKPWMYQNGVWARPPGLVFSSIVSATAITVANEQACDQSFSIPANTLKVGSTIRVRAAFDPTNAAGGGNVSFRLRIGGVGGSVIAQTSIVAMAVGADAVLEAVVVVQSIGAAGVLAGGGVGFVGSLPANAYCQVVPVGNIDTTGALVVVGTINMTAAGGNSTTMRHLSVEIY